MEKHDVLNKKNHNPIDRWTIQDAIDTYNINEWGLGFFRVSKDGNLLICPNKEKGEGLEIVRLIRELKLRGTHPPILLRFNDILKRRIVSLNMSFRQAIRKYHFKGKYHTVYPIKVNQHRHIVENIVEYGRPFAVGLEAGSKPELLIAIAVLNNPEALIICNGYKDHEYVETAILAQKLGLNICLVVEKPSELKTIARIAKARKVKPMIGFRVKLSSKGRGRWEASGGDRAKFGLFINELIDGVKFLKKVNLVDSIKLLHFHLGSQIPDIQRIKDAINEASRIFVELYRMGVPLKYMDIGGGLAVDYDGSKTNYPSSANYTMEEYSADVISTVADVCKETGVPHPDIISESGRALVAHHAMLVVDVLGTSKLGDGQPLSKLKAKTHDLVKEMEKILNSISIKNFQEVYHDALQCRNEALSLFKLGYLSLEDRATMEKLFWAICRNIQNYIRELDYVPEELEGLESFLAAIYFCNFSVFQSVPDNWAINQLFPVLPIHRLDEPPVENGILADITCDSDGKIDQFIDLKDVKSYLPLHRLKLNEPYYIGIFLVGAYQEILGDLHNLFGDTHMVHVSIFDNGNYIIDRAIEGDTVMEVLNYVQYTKGDLITMIRMQIERGLNRKSLTLDESAFLLNMYERGLDGYTYFHNLQ